MSLHRQQLSAIAICALGVTVALVAALPAQAEPDSNANESDDIIQLESSFAGDKEQPAVSYFVPWQGPKQSRSLSRMKEESRSSTEKIDRDTLEQSLRLYRQLNLEGK